MLKYKIVTDSSSDLLTLPDIPFATVPLKIIAGEKEFVDDNDLDVSDMLQYPACVRDRTYRWSQPAAQLRPENDLPHRGQIASEVPVWYRRDNRNCKHGTAFVDRSGKLIIRG